MEKTIEAKPSNRRRSPRRRPRGSVKLECRRGSSGLGLNLTVAVLDLADTGVRLIVKEALDVPAEVEILISGYGISKSIRRLATVRWQLRLDNGSYCVGVEFQKQLQYREWQVLAAP